MIRWMASNPAVRPRAALPDVSEFGLPELEITTVVDVRAAMVAKCSAIAAHESQVGDFGPFVAMPGEQVEAATPSAGSLSTVAGAKPTRKAWPPYRRRQLEFGAQHGGELPSFRPCDPWKFQRESIKPPMGRRSPSSCPRPRPTVR
jgi:hypothetical protein